MIQRVSSNCFHRQGQKFFPRKSLWKAEQTQIEFVQLKELLIGKKIGPKVDGMNLTTPSQTIFFDLGGVLIDFSYDKMWKQLEACTGISQDDLRTLFLDEKWNDAYERGTVNSQEIYEKLKTLAPLSFSLQEMLDAVSNIFTHKPEIPPLLETLSKRNLQLILLSNTCEAHFWYAEKNFSFLSYFDYFVLSYKVKARKPEKEIFEAALAVAACPTKHCFYTDDMKENVEAAEKLGIPSHHFTGVEGLMKALSINPPEAV